MSIFYEIDMVLDFGGTTTVVKPDPVSEALYLNCYEEKDERMHAEAFGTIDNPDVQREFISANRQRIEAECRAEHPPKSVEIVEESPLNLIDMKARFW